MLTTFLEWAHHMQAACIAKSMPVLITQIDDPDNPSARLELETSANLGRVTFWESGDFEAEVVTRDTADTIYLKLGAMGLGRSRSLTKIFAPFVEMLGTNSARGGAKC